MQYRQAVATRRQNFDGAHGTHARQPLPAYLPAVRRGRGVLECQQHFPLADLEIE